VPVQQAQHLLAEARVRVVAPDAADAAAVSCALLPFGVVQPLAAQPQLHPD
jgi:hypothetical protein